MGDFNFHWENENNPGVQHLKDMLSTFNMLQHVNDPTHSSGHTLDWVISRSDDDILSSVDVSVPLSDHHCINAILNLKKPPLPTKTITFWQYKKIDKERFLADLEESNLIKEPVDTLEELIDQYNSTLCDLLNKHAPLKTKNITIWPIVHWYSYETKSLKVIRRKCENRWRASKLTVHRQAYNEARNAVTGDIAKAKTNHFKTRVDECGNDQKALFRVIDEILHTKDKKSLPQHSELNYLLQQFSDFFQQKIAKI